MAAFYREKVLSVRHWTDTLFSFRATRDSGFRFQNGQFAMIGLEVESVGVKDIILPGEIKTILSKVVEAEKAKLKSVILAVAIFLDATVIRMVLVPSTMRLMRTNL